MTRKRVIRVMNIELVTFMSNLVETFYHPTNTCHQKVGAVLMAAVVVVVNEEEGILQVVGGLNDIDLSDPDSDAA
jgi:hypothetical protein